MPSQKKHQLLQVTSFSNWPLGIWVMQSSYEFTLKVAYKFFIITSEDIWVVQNRTHNMTKNNI